MTQSTEIRPATGPSDAATTEEVAPATGADGQGGGAPVSRVSRARRRPGDRPGWVGAGAVAAGAALLSSVLTAGALTWTGHDPAAAPTTTSSSAPVYPGTSTASTWTTVAAAVEPSVVTVAVSDGEGSGVVLDTSGHVLTNNHVVAAAGNGGITVTLSDGRAYPATVVGTDPTTDLAVLKLSTVPSGLTPATLGDSSTVRVGDAVMAIGNPLGLSDTATTGIVSAVDRPVGTSSSETRSGAGSGQRVVTNAIQTDAAINPGNSGGALVDTQGRVVGITSSIASLTSSASGSQSGSIGLGFAIPVNQAKDVAQQLIATGTAQHAYLGVGLSDGTVTVDGAQRSAAMIGSVSAGTPAAGAGLAAGDAVTAADGAGITSADQLIGTIRARRPGTTVQLTVVRDGNSRTVSLTLTTAPATTG